MPVVKAHGGDGRSVNWALIKSQEEADSEGPGFFYFPCDMEVVPQGHRQLWPDKAQSRMEFEVDLNLKIALEDYDEVLFLN